MEMKRSNENRAGLAPRDWWVLGIGALIVVALVAFVVLRMNRNREERTAGASAPAPSTAASSPAAPNMDEASVRRINPDELRAAMSRGEVTVIDVRDADSYAAGHIPGALHIPVSLMENEVPVLPLGKAIVTYCT